MAVGGGGLREGLPGRPAWPCSHGGLSQEGRGGSCKASPRLVLHRTNNNNSRKATISNENSLSRAFEVNRLYIDYQKYWPWEIIQKFILSICCLSGMCFSKNVFCYTFCHLKKGDNFSVTGIRQVYPFWFLLACGQKLMWSFFHTSKILEAYVRFWAFFQGAEERWTTLFEELLRIRLWSQPGPKFRSIWGTYKLHCYTASLNHLFSCKMRIVISTASCSEGSLRVCFQRSEYIGGPNSGSPKVVAAVVRANGLKTSLGGHFL